MATKQKRIGRPPKKPQQGTRVSLGLKVTPQIKGRLDAVARANGRTQSQEAERLIEQAVRDEELFGGSEMRFTAHLMAAAFAIAARSSQPNRKPADWINAPSAYIAGMNGVIRALIANLPNEQDRKLAVHGVLSAMQTLALGQTK